jgi:hypothetical protein
MHKISKYESIDIEYLINASPETVYDWLLENMQEFKYGKRAFLLQVLLEKNNPIINLALASVCTNETHIQRLWDYEIRGLRIAIAANQLRDNSFETGGWIKHKHFISTINQYPMDTEFLKAFCTNPALKGDDLSNLLLRKECYKNISEYVFHGVYYYALQNPNLAPCSDKNESMDFDGFANYERDKAIRAAWSLLVTLPNNWINAQHLENIKNISEFIVPFEMENLIPLVKKSNDRDNDLVFLEHILERWNARASSDPKAFENDGNERYEFQYLREIIATKVPRYNKKILKYIELNSDLFVRRGFYKIFEPDTTKIDDFYRKDGYNFLESALENKNMYKSDAVSEKFESLINNHKIAKDNVVSYQSLRFHFEQYREQYSKVAMGV